MDVSLDLGCVNGHLPTQDLPGASNNNSLSVHTEGVPYMRECGVGETDQAEKARMLAQKQGSILTCCGQAVSLSAAWLNNKVSLAIHLLEGVGAPDSHIKLSLMARCMPPVGYIT